MKTKNILILNGHPDEKSFNHALAMAYYKGARQANSNVSIIHLRDLKFNPNLQYGYRKRTDLESDLLSSIEKIKEADHIVWVFPMWWYGYPALLKGFIDRTFLPGITYDFEKGKSTPKKLLQGKSSRIIITADTPRWYDRLVMGSPAINQFKKGTLQFCGIRSVKVTYISPIKNSKERDRKKWLNKVTEIGSRDISG